MKAGITLLLALIVLTSLIMFYSHSKACFTNFECKWEITNCCPETAGARWECVNIKSFNRTRCPKFIVCPQYLSPKPNLSCMCERGECVAR